MIEIHTERLLIRDYVYSDLEAMHAWVSDPEVMKFLDWKTNTLAETSKMLDDAIHEINLHNREKYFFAIVHKKSNKNIGDVGFTVISRNDSGGIADSGFFLLKEYWGAGYAVEAFHTLIEFAFLKLGLHKVIAGCDAENKASEMVMIKCGLSREGTFRKHHFHRGKWCDRLKYGLLKDDWSKLKVQTC